MLLYFKNLNTEQDGGPKNEAKSFWDSCVSGRSQVYGGTPTSMSKKKLARRSKVKPFVKVVNYNHILPTRFHTTGEFSSEKGELKSVVTEEKLNKPETRKNMKDDVKKIFTDRYNAPDRSNEKQPAVDFFFKKLRF